MNTIFNELKFKKYPVLDKGFICLVDCMGDDFSIVQAARVSYDKDITERINCPDCGRDWGHGYCGTCKGVGHILNPMYEESKSPSKNRQLIRYLMAHQHTTPFEMVEIKFMVQVPMDCWRQWIRHRTACLSSDTELVFNRPIDNKAYKMTIGEVYSKFQPTVNNRPDKQRNPYFKRDRIQKMQLRCLDEITGEPKTTTIVDIWQTGIKIVYNLILSNGRSIKASKDHRILTETGWKALKDIGVGECVTTISSRFGEVIKPVLNKIDLDTEEWTALYGWEDYYEISDQGRVRRIVGGRGSRSYGKCKVITVSSGRAVVSLNKPNYQATIQIHRAMLLSFYDLPEDTELTESCHKDGNSLNNVLENLYWGTSKTNGEDMVEHGTSTYLTAQPVTVLNIVELPPEMTYDIEVEGPNHNFSANDIIVHNSVNEYSTRYTEAIDLCQTTDPSAWRLQATDNKQGSSGFLNAEGKGQDGTSVWDAVNGTELSETEKSFHMQAANLYRYRLAAGVAKEQARKDLPLSTYTRAYWKCDLHNIFNFLRLRMDSHAQYEIRMYANAMYEIVKQIVPVACEAFEDYVLNACKFSAIEMQILRQMVNHVEFEDWNDINLRALSNREVAAFKKKVGV